ncbi:hypothetical protein HMPREF0389_00683 [Filifactor alocis ATCC 35896]|uniref:Uncharacterized protein n=1 Tax=Filifactor alocis (strain ATCC 35896 / CCUG 47790 / D40 B5) TaxID=546269 RepID=D6GPR0_FILAD|nr:hypothetical protein HMPREF0389_00683 [Filifactor alocis ATCC 35896]
MKSILSRNKILSIAKIFLILKKFRKQHLQKTIKQRQKRFFKEYKCMQDRYKNIFEKFFEYQNFV